MTYYILDQGFSINLIRHDGESVCLQGQDATTFRDGWLECPSEWDISTYINEVGYDILFES